MVHDVSARDWQMETNGGQWLLGKCQDGYGKNSANWSGLKIILYMDANNYNIIVLIIPLLLLLLAKN